MITIGEREYQYRDGDRRDMAEACVLLEDLAKAGLDVLDYLEVSARHRESDPDLQTEYLEYRQKCFHGTLAMVPEYLAKAVAIACRSVDQEQVTSALYAMSIDEARPIIDDVESRLLFFAFTRREWWAFDMKLEDFLSLGDVLKNPVLG